MRRARQTVQILDTATESEVSCWPCALDDDWLQGHQLPFNVTDVAAAAKPSGVC